MRRPGRTPAGGPVPAPGPVLSRRAVLTGGLVLTVVACRHRDRQAAGEPADAAALAAARRSELALLASYDAAILAARPAAAARLATARAAHAEHLQAVDRLAGTPRPGGAAPSASPPPSPPSEAEVATREHASVAPLQAAAVTARSGRSQPPSRALPPRTQRAGPALR